MATTYGLTATGFAIKTLDQILLELQQAFQAAFGAGIDVSGNSILGQLIGILAGREADLWELAQAVYHAAFPDTAQGVDLSYAVTLTGQQRLAAAFSTVQAYFSGPANSNITISAGTQVGVALAPPPDPGSQIASGVVFQTTADVTLDQWGHASTTMVATATGPLAAPMGTLILPVTPLPAGVTVTNPTDAALGRDDESDPQLRSRRAMQLVTAVGGTQTAIQEALLKVPGVSFAAATENTGDTTDANGVPPHSLHVFVLGGLDSDVAQAIWNAKPAGANTYGANSATIVDTYGNQQTVYWDRGQDVPIYLIVQRTTTTAYPADGDQQIVDALLAYGVTLSTGDTVFNWRLAAALNSIPGIDTLQILQGTAPSPTSSSNTPIAGNQIATFAAQNIVVELLTTTSTASSSSSTSSSSTTSSTSTSSSTATPALSVPSQLKVWNNDTVTASGLMPGNTYQLGSMASQMPGMPAQFIAFGNAVTASASGTASFTAFFADAGTGLQPPITSVTFGLFDVTSGTSNPMAVVAEASYPCGGWAGISGVAVTRTAADTFSINGSFDTNITAVYVELIKGDYSVTFGNATFNPQALPATVTIGQDIPAGTAIVARFRALDSNHAGNDIGVTVAGSATLTATVSGTTVTLAWSGIDVTTQIKGSDGAMYTPNYVRVGLSNGYYSLLSPTGAGSTSFQSLPVASYTATVESYYQSTSMMSMVTGAGPVQASVNFAIA